MCVKVWVAESTQTKHPRNQPFTFSCEELWIVWKTVARRESCSSYAFGAFLSRLGRELPARRQTRARSEAKFLPGVRFRLRAPRAEGDHLPVGVEIGLPVCRVGWAPGTALRAEEQ